MSGYFDISTDAISAVARDALKGDPLRGVREEWTTVNVSRGAVIVISPGLSVRAEATCVASFDGEEVEMRPKFTAHPRLNFRVNGQDAFAHEVCCLIDAGFLRDIGIEADLSAWDDQMRRNVFEPENGMVWAFGKENDRGGAYVEWLVGKLQKEEHDPAVVRVFTGDGVVYDGAGKAIAFPVKARIDDLKILLADLGDKAFLRSVDQGVLGEALFRRGVLVLPFLKGEAERPPFFTGLWCRYSAETMDRIIRPLISPEPFAPVTWVPDAGEVIAICRAEMGLD